MAIRNVTVEDQGNNWKVTYEWQVGDGPWSVPFEANFPADFNELPQDEKFLIMFSLASAVARGQGVHP